MSEHAWPARTACPLSLFAFAFLFLGTRLALEGPIALPTTLPEEPLLWWALAAFAAVGAIAASRRAPTASKGHAASPDVARVLAVLASALSAACAGAALGRATLSQEARSLEALASHAVSTWELTIVRDPSPTDRGYWSAADVRIGSRSCGRVWVSSDEPLPLGARLRCVGRFEPPGNDAWGVSSQVQGITGTVDVVSVLSEEGPRGLRALFEELRGWLLERIAPEESPGRALVAASVLGSKEGIKRFGIDDLFSEVGLSHLIAVSGLHVALLLGIVGAALARLRWNLGIRAALLLVVGIAYVLLCGEPASALRSYVMVGASELALLAGRRAWSLNALGLCATFMVLLHPPCVGDLGFCLSVLCVAAITLLGPWLRALLGVDGRIEGISRRRWIRRGLAEAWRALKLQAGLAVLCSLVSAPLVAGSFGELSLVAPVSAMVLVAPFEAFLVLAFSATFLSWASVVGGAILALAAAAGDGLILAIVGLARLPFTRLTLDVAEPWASILPWAVLLAGWLWWPHVRGSRVVLAGGLGLASLSLALAVRPILEGARIVVLDVGQGDAILVQDGWHAVLVDTGPDASVVEALQREGVLSLDAVILTHQHEDHAGGLAELPGKVRVGATLVPVGQEGAMGDASREAVERLGAPVHEMRAGAEVRVGSFTLTMLWPKEAEDGDENDESLVMRVDCHAGEANLSGLLTGDAEGDVLRELLDEGLVGDIDFLKVGHHGSAVSIDADEAREIRAEVAVASAGEGNRYGHPTEECIEALASAGTSFLCTKDVGSVEIKPGESGPLVSTERAPASALG